LIENVERYQRDAKKAFLSASDLSTLARTAQDRIADIDIAIQQLKEQE
jgi:hypothetical protein